jgi:hypothetical protein
MPKQLSSAASDTLPAPIFVYDAPSEQMFFYGLFGLCSKMFLI